MRLLGVQLNQTIHRYNWKLLPPRQLPRVIIFQSLTHTKVERSELLALLFRMSVRFQLWMQRALFFPETQTLNSLV